MSNFDFPKKLLLKKIKIITTREGNFFMSFLTFYLHLCSKKQLKMKPINYYYGRDY
jgi:hypothetical protein